MLPLPLIVMLTVGAGASGCPLACTCHNYPSHTTLYYTKVSCDSYPENITSAVENTTRSLEVSGLDRSQFTDLLNEISELSFLTELIVTKSDIANASVDGLERIESLTLMDDGLDSLPLFNLSNLRALDLSRNVMGSIQFQPFRTLRTLEVLNLSANSLTGIESSGFSGLVALKCLDLSENNLTALDDGVLTPLLALQHLNLSHNRLEALNEACFSSLVILQQLDVSWNRLARVAPGTLHLPSLARLLLAGNPRLGRSREAAVLVGTGRRLQIVDASRTGLKQVPAALTHSIRTLRLAGNSIRTVSCGDLDSYPLLQLLDFTSNGLEKVEEDALGRLESLTVLYLTDNSIREIPGSLPEKLKVLHLESNAIERVSARDFSAQARLEVLLLNDNKISAIEEAAFGQLVSLVTLDLSRNPLTVLRPGCLAGPSSLQVLRLASIETISPAEEVSFPLSATEHLITLDLSDSPGLARQLLADTAALVAARELQELDLSRTDLEVIRFDLLHFLPQLRALHVKDNRLNCSRLEWLAAWMRRQDAKEYKGVICASPPDLWGTPVIDLQDVEISSTINQDRQDINLGNFTRQYSTTASTNYVSLSQDVSNSTLPPEGNSTTKTVDKPRHVDFTNEIEKINVEITKPIKKGLITTRQDIKSETTRANLLTTIFSVSNDPIETASSTTNGAQDIINEAAKVPITETSSAAPLVTLDSPRILLPESAENDVRGQQWNASSGEMSMYTIDKQEGGFLHPGMLILAAGVLGAAASLAMLAARCTRSRRNPGAFSRQEDVEVNGLPSVTELW